ncbi:cytochrome b-c1 complex subunit 7 [Xylariomycetidae sp. FL0641]|nr:cytochrome b-c1 complex subunit 7 [Xylariomycetidae sp. FL0641]
MVSAYPTLAPFVLKRPWLKKIMMPFAQWYMNAAGHRQLGLLSDDLIIEENEDVLKALKRLPPQVQYDRVYRIRRAVQCGVTHKLLPKDQWTKPQDDVPYLTPILEMIKAEEKQKRDLDSLTVVKNH